HVVQVGRRGDSLALRFTPEDTTADVGDMVQFQFYPLNHSVAEATFDKPCVPATDDTSALGNAFWSGFHPLPTDTEILDTFTVNITSIAPIFYYCSQGRHCMQGFVGTINAGPDQLAAFKAAA
ncbi:hypothetical protein BZA05DRAFT_313788, partial [Tricharina praecox]|uniref:uncharacterized protein n=1 Tax=Tricharina praecox TaxID=43433 RepID=UPI00221E866C